VGIGVFIGCMPLYGLHLPLCLAICLPLRLDAVIAYLAANISNPLFAPALLALETQVGALLLTGELRSFELVAPSSVELLKIAEELVVGSVAVGALLAVCFGGVAYAVARRCVPDSALENALARTGARYARAAAGDRHYVSAKLRLDPVLRSLRALGPLGRVIDAGAGRGQLGLALLDLGQLTALSGFDFDERKISVANAAAQGDARFEVADLRSAPFGPADTILLIDVLHYLRTDEQDALLGRVRAALAPGGRLVLREVDGRRAIASWFSRSLERTLSRFGYNRAARPLEFRSAAEIIAQLRTLGFDCVDHDAAAGTPFDNRLFVAEVPRRADSVSAPASS
jgi:SAM-dependent methyltransferase